MKLCTFEVDTGFGARERVGVIAEDGRIIDIGWAYALTLALDGSHPRPYEMAEILLPSDMSELLRNDVQAREAVVRVLRDLEDELLDPHLQAPGGEPILYSPDDVMLLSPLPRPTSLRAPFEIPTHTGGPPTSVADFDPVSRWLTNMRSDADASVFVQRSVESVSGAEEEVLWPQGCDALSWHVRIACVIGRDARPGSTDEAADAVAGFMIYQDFAPSRRLDDAASVYAIPGAGDADGTNALGPCIVTADEFAPNDARRISVRIDDEEVASTRISRVAGALRHATMLVNRYEAIRCGDVLSTPSLLSASGEGQLVLPGSRVEVEVEGLGTLVSLFVREDREDL